MGYLHQFHITRCYTIAVTTQNQVREVISLTVGCNILCIQIGVNSKGERADVILSHKPVAVIETKDSVPPTDTRKPYLTISKHTTLTEIFAD